MRKGTRRPYGGDSGAMDTTESKPIRQSIWKTLQVRAFVKRVVLAVRLEFWSSGKSLLQAIFAKRRAAIGALSKTAEKKEVAAEKAKAKADERYERELRKHGEAQAKAKAKAIKARAKEAAKKAYAEEMKSLAAWKDARAKHKSTSPIKSSSSSSVAPKSGGYSEPKKPLIEDEANDDYRRYAYEESDSSGSRGSRWNH